MFVKWIRTKETGIMILILLSTLIILCSLAEADTLRIIDSSGAPCDAGVVVPVHLTNSMAVAGISFRIVYDPEILTPALVDSAGTRLGGLFEVFGYNFPEPGVTTFLGLSSYLDPEAYSLPAGSGPIAYIIFSIDCFTCPSEVAIRFEEDPSTPEPDNSLSDSLGITFIIPTLIDGVLTVAYSYNHPPVINPIPGGNQQSVQEGKTLAFEVSAYDPDGDTLEMYATGLPAQATFPFLSGEGTVSGPFSFTPDFTQGGKVYDVAFIAYDTSGLSTSDTVEITVVEVPFHFPPAPPDSLRAIGGATFVTLTWMNPRTNENGDELSDLDGISIYRNGAVIDSVATIIPGSEESYVDSNLVGAEYMYCLKAYSEFGLSAPSDSISIEVCGLRCDDNNDWWIDILDVIREINFILGIEEPSDSCGFWRADCNGDGVLNIFDVLAKINCILGIGTCPPTGLAKITPAVMEYLHSLESYFQDGDFDRLLTLVKGEKEVPTEYRLSQNYPNPFNPNTTIRYAVPRREQRAESGGEGEDSGLYALRTTLKIYNILGQEVRTLVCAPKEAGYYTVTWNSKDNIGRDVASGVYFYCLSVDDPNESGLLRTGQWSETKKMLLLK